MAGIHDGHRDRLRETFVKTGLDDFHPHNVLELLLFYSIPRKDTNEIAHALIEEFGSIDRVFEAEIEELVKVKGITYNSAVLIKMIPQLARYYLSKKADKGQRLTTSAAIAEYLSPKFIGEVHEVVYVLFLDSKLQVVTCKKINEGTVDSVDFRVDQVLKIASSIDANRIVIAHNHPDGDPMPSAEDISLTFTIRKTLEMFNKELLDHLVFGANGYMSIEELILSKS